ncbi:AmpG family muropeptide MFS transporter [Telmatospirillum sp.]|uniref:AmpG family muropeptide MFS transporter n=1 Tax=Telmatospirillum sp. TaxID=2079197 RepID=UPI00283CCDC3|nr:MFS transporter [Telmatospirillum sp.]MDR3440392.1 MFS transporter [Telmatospirillum sp.]
MSAWRQALAGYRDRRVLAVLLVGFSSGLPLLLTYSTLSAWLAKEGISRSAIGLFALVGTPYALKFLWSPLIDRLPPPLPIGRRRGWGVSIQLALMVAILALGTLDPHSQIGLMAALAVLVAFLSASQDIVIDAFRIELLDEAQQGPGAGAVQVGYRFAMLAAGAGALFLADTFGWTIAYGTMAALLGVGVVVLLCCDEPCPTAAPSKQSGDLKTALTEAVIKPFADLMQRPAWPLALVFIVTYKLGEAMAGIMAVPLYVSVGFSLTEIAGVSKIFGFFATILGCLLGGAVVARFGCLKALLACGILQSLGNLFYILQAGAGHHLEYLALCVAAENLTGGMAGTALVAYISGLCNVSYTATQYALMSSLTSLGRTLFASSAGILADRLGWEMFFLLTTVVTVPALLLLLWMMARLPSLVRPAAEG